MQFSGPLTSTCRLEGRNATSLPRISPGIWTPNRDSREMLKPIPRERFGAIPLTLLFITLLAAIPRLYVGSTQYVEYDGYWHVFIAMQDNLRQFYKEYWINFHPPLFYLLLRLALNFGRTPLVYRSISLLTGIAAVFFIGKIAEKISVTRWMSAVAALI